MPVTTYVDRASERVDAEQDAVAAKQRAFDAFVDRVREIPAESMQPASGGVTATVGAPLDAETADVDRCRAVRTAAAETFHPECAGGDDRSVLATVREELGDAVAAALSPTTDASFGPETKQAVLSEATNRRAKAVALRRALSAEATQLEAAGAVVEDVTAWIVEADETPLTALDFDALRRRHETLADHRDRCGELAEQRQAFLDSTTNEGVQAGVRHRSLIPYLYGDLPVDHPVLATVSRLDDACADCQRAVRTHLVRRA